jgi:hypothetical protein
MFGQEGKYTVEALLEVTLRIDHAVEPRVVARGQL